MARSIKEARQLITHRHIEVDDRIIDTPSYLVEKDEEDKISFSKKSPIASSAHPLRSRVEKSE